MLNLLPLKQISQLPLLREQNRNIICKDLYITYIVIQNIQYNYIHVTYNITIYT